MACDNCPRKYTFASSHFILDIGISTKLFRRSLCSSNVMISYVALLQLCLFVNCCEALNRGVPEHPHLSLSLSEAKLNSVILPNKKLNVIPDIVDPVHERSSSIVGSLKLVKRQAVDKPDDKTDSSQEKDKSSSFSSTDPINDSKTLDSKAVVQESKDLDSEVVDDPPAVSVNTTPKPKAVASSHSNSSGQAADNSEEDELGIGPPSGLKPDAILRLFYVFVFVGVIVLIYILIKFLRFRRKRATRKYRVLSHTDEQEMFPLAADDGDDEEIFNAADHQTLK